MGKSKELASTSQATVGRHLLLTGRLHVEEPIAVTPSIITFWRFWGLYNFLKVLKTMTQK